MTELDWNGLRSVARDAMPQGYVPNSKFPVGAAALVDDGRVNVGCNAENISYGFALRVECALVSSLHMTGGGKLLAIAREYIRVQDIA